MTPPLLIVDGIRPVLGDVYRAVVGDRCTCRSTLSTSPWLSVGLRRVAGDGVQPVNIRQLIVYVPVLSRCDESPVPLYTILSAADRPWGHLSGWW